MKVDSAEAILHNFEKSSNIPKIWQIMKKILVQACPINTFFGSFRVPKNPISAPLLVGSTRTVYVKCEGHNYNINISDRGRGSSFFGLVNLEIGEIIHR